MDEQPVHTPHLTWEQCLERWPRLVRAIQWVIIGSYSEAACCIRDYRDGLRYGGEAVSHSGLSPRDRVEQASSATTRRVLRYFARADRERNSPQM